MASRRGPSGGPRRAGARVGVLIEFLGVILLLGAGVFWLGGLFARDSADRYRTAPLCAAGGPTPCRTVQPATVVGWSAAGANRRSVTVRLADGSRQTLTMAGGDLFEALRPDLPVQAEFWTGQIVRLSDANDHTLTTENDPTQVSYDNPLGSLLGGLGVGCVVLGVWIWRARR